MGGKEGGGNERGENHIIGGYRYHKLLLGSAPDRWEGSGSRARAHARDELLLNTTGNSIRGRKVDDHNDDRAKLPHGRRRSLPGLVSREGRDGREIMRRGGGDPSSSSVSSSSPPSSRSSRTC